MLIVDDSSSSQIQASYKQGIPAILINKTSLEGEIQLIEPNSLQLGEERLSEHKAINLSLSEQFSY